MNPEEYAALNAVEHQHWFYHGKRTIVRRWIERRQPLSNKVRLLDFGCGTGLFAEEMSRYCQAIGVDDHDEALAIARSRSGPTFVQATSGRLPFDDGAFDVATALDVLEHLPDDLEALREMARVVRPGGVVVVTVPAFMMLWSEWDVVLHHQRRYRKYEVVALAEKAGLKIQTCRYINSVVFIPVVAYRKLREWTPFLKGGTRAEDRIPAPWLNGVLEWCFVEPACWRWFHPPFGVSVLAVLKRPE